MRFLSLFSGIEAASAAWLPLGWECAGVAEIEPFPCSVLEHRYPDVPNLGDVTRFGDWPDYAIDLLCGGTPCQSFSVAGLRKGLDDPRGNLLLAFGSIAARYRPKWLLWENVPGVLSSNGGRDFGAFLGLLGELGYGFAYRILDAQYFGVPQRRRRVFVVGCLGDWRRAAAVLFERHSLQGHPSPRREAGKETARCLTHGPSGGQRYDGETETFICVYGISPDGFDRDGEGAGGTAGERSGLRAKRPGGVAVTHALTGEGFDASEDGTGRGTPLVPLAFDCKASGQNGFGVGSIASTQRAMGHAASHTNGGGHQAALIGSAVRRLTPRECERLQGFPDDWTLVPHRGKPAADGPRYKAIGNSWAVPVVRWIGERIQSVAAA